MDDTAPWSHSPVLAWGAGIVLPVIMLVIDPAVFRSEPMTGGPILGYVAPGCYFAMGAGMLALGCHLLVERRSAFVAGVLAASTAFAAVLGLVLLPFSFLGVLFNGIGILGLSPFFTAVAIGSQVRHAFPQAPGEPRPRRFWLGAAAYLVGGLLVQLLVGHALRQAFA